MSLANYYATDRLVSSQTLSELRAALVTALFTTLPASAALVLLLLRPYSSFEGQLETHLLQEPASEPPLNFGISPTAEYLIVL